MPGRRAWQVAPPLSCLERRVSGGPTTRRKYMRNGRWGSKTPPAVSTKPELQRGGAATRRGQLLLRARGELVRRDVQLDGDVAVAEDLHQLVLADQARLHQLVDADRAAVGEQAGDVAHVHRLVLGAEAVLEATQLRQPHVDRHLAALEAGRHVLACLGALGAAAGGLAALAAFTTADPLLLRL